MYAGTERPPFSKLHHVGVVVADIEAAIAHFEGLGFGPFWFAEDVRTFTIPFTGELHGRPVQWTTTVTNGKMGDIDLELLEPGPEAQALRESLESTGEGLHHIGFITEDFDGDLAAMLERGAKVWCMSKRDDAPSFVYFEPSGVGNMAIELRTAGPG